MAGRRLACHFLLPQACRLQRHEPIGNTKVGDDITLTIGHPYCNGAPLEIHVRDDTMNRPGATLNLITVLSQGRNPRVSNFNHRKAYLFDTIPEFQHHAIQVEAGVLIL